MSLRSKLLVVVLLTSAFVSAVFLIWGARLEAHSARVRTERQLEQQTVVLELLAQEITDDDRLTAVVGQIAARSGARVLYLDASARVRIDSGRQIQADSSGTALRGKDEVTRARFAGTGVAIFEDAQRMEVVSFARRIDGRAGIAFVVGQSPVRFAEGVASASAWPLVLALGGAFGFLVLAVHALTSRLLRPLRRLTTAAERVAAGALDEALPIESEAEVQRLRTAVEKMRTHLVAQLHDLERERRLLRTTTEGLQEGLLLVSGTRRILLANQAFRRLLRLPFHVSSRQLGEVVRHPEVLRAIEDCLSTGESQHIEVSGVVANNRSYQIGVTPVELLTGMGALAVFFDVTRLEALERVRRQFVADVSHELKTPVTAVRGAIETLLETELATRPAESRFLEIARRQAERMHHLISDLLDLSRIETGAVDLYPEEVAVEPLVERVAEAALSRRPDAGLRVVAEMPPGQLVYADARRLEQILQNLVDNAVKVSPVGGRITVSAVPTPEAVVLRVRDEGPGIPPDAVEKVFNRFFRLDEARARDTGGTGIGLSIVKHLMKLHLGSVHVESPPGQGASFLLEFPHAPT